MKKDNNKEPPLPNDSLNGCCVLYAFVICRFILFKIISKYCNNAKEKCFNLKLKYYYILYQNLHTWRWAAIDMMTQL